MSCLFCVVCRWLFFVVRCVWLVEYCLLSRVCWLLFVVCCRVLFVDVVQLGVRWLLFLVSDCAPCWLRVLRVCMSRVACFFCCCVLIVGCCLLVVCCAL